MSSQEKGGIIFVPCVKWIKQGVAKANPEQVKLTEEELANLLAEERANGTVPTEERESDESDADDEERTRRESAKESRETEMEEELSDSDSLSKYKLDDYDDDESNPITGLAGLTLYASNKHDPYVTIKDSDDEDSEKEDDEIKPTDNLILVGKVHGDEAVLQVFVYNDNGDTLYVHHDILLPDIPLCVEWLNYDPASPTNGNLCAIGGMSPVIQVLDLDLMDSLEPAYVLGEPVAPKNPVSVHFQTKNKLSKKKARNHKGHTDAVLDLSWNTNFTHVLASGSVDETVLLWDLEDGSVHTKLTAFKDKIQTLKWHPFEGQTLLTGCCDKYAKVFDCRSADSFKAWELSGEIERVIWDQYNPFCFVASTDKGQVHYVDCRNEKPIWELGAHSQECTGLSFSSQCPGMLITTSNDGSMKVWDLAHSTRPSCVWETELKIGSIQCLDVCPDFPFTVAAGGDKKSCHFVVRDLSSYSPVASVFASRNLVVPVKVEGLEMENGGTEMESSGTAAEAEEEDGDSSSDHQDTEQDREPQPGPSSAPSQSVQAAMSKLKVSNGAPIRKPKLPPRAKIIQKRKKKASKKGDIFSKPT